MTELPTSPTCHCAVTDPVTLELRNEEGLLQSIAEDRDTYYREVLLPYKLRGNARYLESRTWRSDLLVIVKTLVAIVAPGRTRSVSP